LKGTLFFSLPGTVTLALVSIFPKREIRNDVQIPAQGRQGPQRQILVYGQVVGQALRESDGDGSGC